MMRNTQTGAEALDRLAGIDLNKDGRIVPEIIVTSPDAAALCMARRTT